MKNEVTENPARRGKIRYISVEPQRRGPKPRFFDEFHVKAREANRRYYWREKLGKPTRRKERKQSKEEREWGTEEQ